MFIQHLAAPSLAAPLNVDVRHAHYMPNSCVVAGRMFHWSVLVSDEYPLLAKPYPASACVEVLRVEDAQSGGFDIALRVDRAADAMRGGVVLGPILVLGSAFPTADSPVSPGSRIRVRPRISLHPNSEIDAIAVQRIVAWCLSEHFRAVPCDRHGLPTETNA